MKTVKQQFITAVGLGVCMLSSIQLHNASATPKKTEATGVFCAQPPDEPWQNRTNSSDDPQNACDAIRAVCNGYANTPLIPDDDFLEPDGIGGYNFYCKVSDHAD